MTPRRLAAAILCGLLLLAGCASPIPSGMPTVLPTATLGPIVSPTPAPAPTPVPPPTARALLPGEDDWARVPFANGLRDRYGSTAINAMAEAGGRIVAVGRGPTGAAAWISTDGINWRRAPGALGDPSSEMRDVVAGGPGFVAVGVAGDMTAAAWTSPDGLTWRRTEFAQAGGWISGLQHVAASGRAIVAVAESSAWESPDGRTWQQVDIPPPSEYAVEFTVDVAAGPSGFLLLTAAPDTEGAEYPTLGQALYTSADGVAWRQVALLDQSCVNCGSYPYFHSIAWWRDRWVAIGRYDSEYAEGETTVDSLMFASGTWTSTDGGSWQREGLALAERAPDGSIGTPSWDTLTVAADGRLLATEPGGRLWVSDDGTSWSRVTAATPAQATPESPDDWPRPTVRGAVGLGGHLLVFGTDLDTTKGNEPRFTAAVWTAPDPGVAEPLQPPAACPAGDPTLIRVLELPLEMRLRCFGGREVSVRAFALPTQVMFAGEPTGLGQFPALDAMAVAGNRSWAMSLPVLVDPASKAGQAMPDWRGGWVWLTGRFDAPKAVTCPASVRPACREALLVTQARKTTAPTESTSGAPDTPRPSPSSNALSATPVPSPSPSPTPVPTPRPAAEPNLWNRVDLKEGPSIKTLVATKDSFVANGPDRRNVTDESEGPLLAWTSPDGIAWTRRSQFVIVDEAAGISLAASRYGLTAFTSSPGCGPAEVWTSVDGRRWPKAPSQRSLSPPGKAEECSSYAVVRVVAQSARERIAAGDLEWNCTDSGCGVRRDLLWRSIDGRHWQRVPLPKGVDRIAYLASFAGGWVAWGRSNALGSRVGTSPDGRRWRWKTTDLDVAALVAVRPDLLVALGSVPGTTSTAELPVLVRSSDGVTWDGARFLPGALADPWRTALHLATDGTTVALLDTGRPVNADADAKPDHTAAAWISVDGDIWTALPELPAWTGPSGARLTQIAVSGSRVVLLGSWKATADADSVDAVWVLDLATLAPGEAP